MIRLCLFALALLISSGTARAEDYVFAPEGCEFRMNFPEQPATGKQCNPDNPAQCHQVTTYHKVYALDAGIHITVTCNPAEKGMMERYSGDVMQYTLGTMAKEHLSGEPQTAFEEDSNAKKAIIIGSQKQDGGREDVYMAQLWIGKKSVMTIEGEITGGELPEADTLFAKIMKSVRHESKDAAAEKPADEDKKDGKQDQEKEKKEKK